MKLLCFSMVLILFTGCSLFDGAKRSPKRQRPVVKSNVPFKARLDGQSLKKRIIVLPFLDVKLQRAKKVTDIARRTVVKKLIRSGSYIVISNNDFPQDLKKFVTEKNEYDLKSISALAASMGVSSILEGKILEVKARRLGDQVGLFRKIRAKVDVKVRVRMVSAKSGAEILNEVRMATVESDTTRVAKYSYSDRFLEEDPRLIRAAVQKAFAGAMRRIYKSVEKLDWEGRVALISGDRIYINAGRISGLQIGELLKVTEEGEEVYDPDSGHFIGRAPGRMKGTVEIVSYFGQDGAIAVVHSGSGFKENDRVELY